jgi:hypothetical protein
MIQIMIAIITTTKIIPVQTPALNIPVIAAQLLSAIVNESNTAAIA